MSLVKGRKESRLELKENNSNLQREETKKKYEKEVKTNLKYFFYACIFLILVDLVTGVTSLIHFFSSIDIDGSNFLRVWLAFLIISLLFICPIGLYAIFLFSYVKRKSNTLPVMKTILGIHSVVGLVNIFFPQFLLSKGEIVSQWEFYSTIFLTVWLIQVNFSSKFKAIFPDKEQTFENPELCFMLLYIIALALMGILM